MIEILIEGMTENPGGKEAYIVNLYKTFDRTRFHFTFISYNDEIAYERFLRESGAEIVRLPPRYDGLFRYRKALDELFRRKKFDVLWAHKTTLSSCEVLEIARRRGVPLRIVHSHSSSNMGGRLTFILHSVNKMFVRGWANAYFACSEPAAAWFYGKKPCTLLKNGIDVEKFRFNPECRKRIRNQLGIADCFAIVHVGRFGVEKNHKKLLGVFHEVRKVRDNAKLILCGDGEERGNIEEQIRELDLEEGVLLLGIISNVHEILQAADLMVMPSLFEGLPFALLEAQAAGLHCVVSDTVSRESDILGGTIFLPLSASNTLWAERILGMEISRDRHDAADQMRREGYDVVDCARSVEKLIETRIRSE